MQSKVERFSLSINAELQLPKRLLCRKSEELTALIPALPCPDLEEIREKFSWVEAVARHCPPTPQVTLQLFKAQRLPGLESVNSVQDGQRELVIRSMHFLLGYQHANWLAQHQNRFPDLLANLWKIKILFVGHVVADAKGELSVPVLGPNPTRWELGMIRMRSMLRGSARIAAL